MSIFHVLFVKHYFNYYVYRYLGPFFPIEAQKRGLDEVEVGFIIGIFAISPEFEKTIVSSDFLKY